MKNATTELITFLQENTQFLMPNLFTFTLNDGAVLRYTDAPASISIAQLGGPAITWIGGDVLIQGLKYKSAVGLDVDQQTLKLGYWPASSVRASLVTVASGATVPFAIALQSGIFDGATLTWERIVIEQWGGEPVGWGEVATNGTVSDGRVIMNEGRVGKIDPIGRIEAQMEIKSPLSLLDIDLPRNLWQSSCIHTFCDPYCTLNKASFETNGTVGAGATNVTIPWIGAVANIYGQGTISFGSGQNTGIKTTIKQSLSGSLILAYPLDYVPAAGDIFTACQGCDKTYARCQSFGNQLNFRGYPDVPQPEQAA
jgi:uncharacterized phage protein (TIGR02218 family)